MSQTRVTLSMDDTSKRIQNISTKKSARFAPLPAGGDNYADDDADNAWDDDEVTAEASEGGMWRQADRYTRKSNRKTGFMSQLRNSVRNSVMRQSVNLRNSVRASVRGSVRGGKSGRSNAGKGAKELATEVSTLLNAASLRVDDCGPLPVFMQAEANFGLPPGTRLMGAPTVAHRFFMDAAPALRRASACASAVPAGADFASWKERCAEFLRDAATLASHGADPQLTTLVPEIALTCPPLHGPSRHPAPCMHSRRSSTASTRAAPSSSSPGAARSSSRLPSVRDTRCRLPTSTCPLRAARVDLPTPPAPVQASPARRGPQMLPTRRR